MPNSRFIAFNSNPIWNRCRHWLPVILWAFLIFYGSAQTRAPQVSRHEQIQLAVQKIGHAVEYGILAFFIFRALRHVERVSLRQAVLFAVILSSAYGSSDEWHQYFVPGRSAEFTDVVIDTTGAAVAMIIFYAYELRQRQQTDR